MKFSRAALMNELKYSVFAGISLGLCLFLQTWGLEFTSATNSGMEAVKINRKIKMQITETDNTKWLSFNRFGIIYFGMLLIK